MTSLYVIYLITFGLLSSAILDLTNLVLFKWKGSVVGYSFKNDGAAYKSYKRRDNKRAMITSSLVVLLLVIFCAVEIRSIIHDGSSGYMEVLIVGSLLMLFICLFVYYSLLSMFGAPGKKKDDWLR